jgi:uncharacterized protein (TIGR02145 family)
MIMKKAILLLTGLAFFTFKNQSQTVIDYDGNVYDTVIIGTQVWLKENLKVTHYNNGVPIPNVTSNTAWASLVTGARCYYNNDSVANDSVYGPLYNWYAVNDINNICPSGWHVSTNAEWQTTETSLGGTYIAGGKMKEAGTVHWLSPNTGATNESGFTGLPGGMRDPINNNFQDIGGNGLWWTATTYNASMVWSTYMWYLFAGVDHNPGTKKYGFSIRCVKDISTGLGDINNIEKIKLYPNPSNSRITIESAEYQNTYLLVYNLFGEMVMHSVLTKSTNEIDISSLPKGVYILKITGERGTMQQKLIKE